jgi:hypothetical protein
VARKGAGEQGRGEEWLTATRHVPPYAGKARHFLGEMNNALAFSLKKLAATQRRNVHSGVTPLTIHPALAGQALSQLTN